jgi:hypothetical protein
MRLTRRQLLRLWLRRLLRLRLRRLRLRRLRLRRLRLPFDRHQLRLIRTGPLRQELLAETWLAAVALHARA